MSTLLALLYLMFSFAVFRSGYGECLTRMGPQTSLAFGVVLACLLTPVVAVCIVAGASARGMLGRIKVPRWLGGNSKWVVKQGERELEDWEREMMSGEAGFGGNMYPSVSASLGFKMAAAASNERASAS